MKKTTLTHGGDWAGFEAEYGKTPLDLSANVSPFGLPQGVKDAIIQSLDHADRYPDPLCRALRKAISEAKNVPEEMILCGNGAADLIFRLALALRPQKALITAPTFAEYKTALLTVDCDVRSFCLKEEEDFRLSEDILGQIDADTDVVFLCEPNNPTGIADKKELLLKVLKKVEDVDALLVVDECFHEFLANPDRDSLIDTVEEHPHLLVLKAFTKVYAMAGVRLGYCLCGNKELLQAMTDCGQPWSVSSLASAAGIAALKEKDYVLRVRQNMNEVRPYLQNALRESGFRVIPGEANYLLFHAFPGLDAKLREKAILIRSCANYEGLGEGWFRTAVRTKEEADQLLQALKEVL